MKDEFKKKDGMFIIEVDGETYYMRSHPKTMLSSMMYKKHDKFLAFIRPDEYRIISVEDNINKVRFDITLTIYQLRDYIKKIEL